MSVIEYINHYLASGALAKGWGGPQCRATVPINVHIWESLGWMTVCAVSYIMVGMGRRIRKMWENIEKDLALVHTSGLEVYCDNILAVVHLLMFVVIVYYKFNIKALVNLLQPCHMIVVLEGIALYSKGPFGVLLSLFILPAMIGTLLAMLWPDVGGLDQPFEMEAYWAQHYLIQFVPIYLLIRRNFLATKYAGPFTVFCGIWFLLLLHFSLYEVVDLVFNVNVEFMLCPTSAMAEAFSGLPPSLQWPSYRSLMTYIVFITSSLISTVYILPAQFIAKFVDRINASQSQKLD